MKPNVGTIDRLLRLVIGAALLTFAMVSDSYFAFLGWLGAVPLLTAAAGFCPLYSLLNIHTCRRR